MICRLSATMLATAFFFSFAVAQEPTPVRPKAGEVEILPSSEIKPGMQGIAWTVFSGNEPEPVPIEIIGLWKNAWGPKQDVIIAKMGGKAARTGVAGGMSGSPVYINGRLAGAVSLRLSVFSPDAICGITPIELMLEVNEFDNSIPADARTPDKAGIRAGLEIPGEMAARTVSAGAAAFERNATFVPIETPLTFSGFSPGVLREFSPLLAQFGLSAVQGGATGNIGGPAPAPGWQTALQPGDAVTGVLVSGDMSITGLGTVTYNDGKRVLAFGHSFFNLGPVDMPMSKADVLFVNASTYQPNKVANATQIVGALKQDRHSAIMGVLGEQAGMVPVGVTVRSFSNDNTVRKQKTFNFHVFVHQKWTPQLMMMTLFNSISGLNDFMEESTYRLSGTVELEGQQNLVLTTMQAPNEMPVPAPMLLAGWWGDKFNRLFLNAVKTPHLKSVNATIDLLPQRRIATIETGWTPVTEAEPGQEIPLKVFLRPYRGKPIEREFSIRIPPGLPRGEHRILLSDADTLNRVQTAARLMNRYIDLPETVSLINQERSNNKLYVSLLQARPTVYYDDKTLPSLPGSVLNVMQAGRAATRPFATSAESALEQTSIPFDYVVNGSYVLRIQVK